MRVEDLIALALVVLLFFYMKDHDAELAAGIASGTPAVFDPWAAEADLFEFDITQRTCALEVVMRPVALQIHDVFHRTVDNTKEPRNAVAGETTLACIRSSASQPPSAARSALP